ncbi:MAG: DUF3467 domain-containing protein [Anaerolineales bacterium]
MCPQSSNKEFSNFPPIKIPADLKTEYVNLVRIAHSPSEMLFDFAHLLPGGGPALAKARIIMSPLAAKLFFRALAENLNKFENTYGEIKIPGNKTLADQLFKAPPSSEETNE